MPRRGLAYVVSMVALAVTLSSCATESVTAFVLVNAKDVSAMVAGADGELLYTNTADGSISSVTLSPLSTRKVATVDSDRGANGGLLGLTRNTATGDVYASWTKNGVLTVSRVLPGPEKVIWQIKLESTQSPLAQLTMTPGGRIVMALSDMGLTAKQLALPNSLGGRFVTIDPKFTPDQSPNVLSAGWHNAEAFAFDQGGNFWAADTVGKKGQMFKVGNAGERVETVALGKGETASGLVKYSERELVACLANSGKLTRYLLQDGTAIAGRVIGEACNGPVAALPDGRVAYATGKEIRVTES